MIPATVMFTWILKVSTPKFCLKFIHLKSEPHLQKDKGLNHERKSFVLHQLSTWMSDVYVKDVIPFDTENPTLHISANLFSLVVPQNQMAIIFIRLVKT